MQQVVELQAKVGLLEKKLGEGGSEIEGTTALLKTREEHSSTLTAELETSLKARELEWQQREAELLQQLSELQAAVESARAEVQAKEEELEENKRVSKLRATLRAERRREEKASRASQVRSHAAELEAARLSLLQHKREANAWMMDVIAELFEAAAEPGTRLLSHDTFVAFASIGSRDNDRVSMLCSKLAGSPVRSAPSIHDQFYPFF